MFKTIVAFSLALFLALSGPIPTGIAEAETLTEKADIPALIDTMRMQETFDVMIDEGKAYGASIEVQMFPSQGGEGWASRVAEIYHGPTLLTTFENALHEELGEDLATISAVMEFFNSARGQEILKLEIAGRRALLDEAVEEAARVQAERMQAERDPRLGQIRDLIEASDLIEMNVAGALSANLAFLEGMSSLGAAASGNDKEQLMTEVWSQEDNVRDETAKWLYPYLALAYQPLSDQDLEAYIAFNQSPSGQRLNSALFFAFDKVFRKVSFDLGRAAALELQGSDI